MLSTKDQITLNHQKAFNILAEIVNHGSDIIQHSPTNIKKIQKRKRILYFMVIASHCHIEAIFTLCKEGRTNSCWPLLRVVLENLINSKFLYTSRSHSSFDKFILWGYKEQKKCFVKLKELSVDDECRKQIGITLLEIEKKIESLNKLISRMEKKLTSKTGKIYIIEPSK